MNASNRPSLARVDRHNWWLWAITFSVLIAMTVTIPVLYMPLLDISSVASEQWIHDGYYAGVGLAGLVIVFCLYLVLKQHQLNHIRRVLQERSRAIGRGHRRLGGPAQARCAARSGRTEPGLPPVFQA